MKIILTIVGLILIVFGLLTVFLPLPTGILSLLAGVAILASISETFRKVFRWLRRKIRPLDAIVDKAEEVLPEPVSKPLRQTDPCHDKEEDDEGEECKEKDGAHASRKALVEHTKDLNRAHASYIRRATRTRPMTKRL